jgi:hypothetical protein
LADKAVRDKVGQSRGPSWVVNVLNGI